VAAVIALVVLLALIIISVLAIAGRIPDHTWSFKLVFALDLFFAAVIFGQPRISISTMSGLVRDGKDGFLGLKLWQRDFLRWLEPRLSRQHVTHALQFDRQQWQWLLDNTPDSLP
jgi:hypothetical protein